MNSNYETKVFQVHTEGDRFGFTLAGEHPCQLVKIQNDSPAERAGLVSGDEVLEVNGINMADLQHDLVASFICPSSDGITEFRIRRSVDLEQPYDRPCQTTERSGPDLQNSITEDITCPVSSRVLSKVVDRVVEEFKSPPQTVAPSSSLGSSMSNGSELASDEELKASFSSETSNLNIYAVGNISTPFTPSTCSKSVQTAVHLTRKLSKIQTVLAYLGSIDCPMTTRTTGDLLVTHLRVKKESSVTTLLEITPVGLYLRNSSHEVIMTCSTASLTFVGICPKNKQIFGLFTRDANAETSKATTVYDRGEITSDLNLNCSCHLFAIEPRLTRHSAHKTLTDRFHLRCNSDPTTGSCQQFPTSSSAILNDIYTLLRDSSAQIPSNEPEIAGGAQIQGTGMACSGPVVGESSGNDPSAVVSLPLQDGNEQELVLCLHLHPLHHTPLTRKQEMNNQPPQEFNLEINYGNRSTMSQSSSSSSSASVTEIATLSTQHNHTRRTLLGVDQFGHQRTSEGSPRLWGKESRGHHKTLIHRRSRSLASNVKNTVHACQATQTTECYSQNDFRIGNGGRPIFHSSSASITMCNSVNSVEGRVARWAVAFDRLLEDSTGMDIFRSFLQKEYSEENLIFWLSCKKYRTICDKNELKISAEEIYDMHLKSCATLPVNVENASVRDVEAKLKNATTELFAVLQHQVYTLMKFDSYTRFLKSELYRKCLVDEMEGRPLPLEREDSKKGDDFSGTLKRMFGSSTKMRGWKSLNKSQSCNETDETKKKSFLPWRVRTKSEQIKKTSNRGSDSSARSSVSSLSDSVFSLTITNSDETLTDSDGRDQIPPTCRVILPNRGLMYLFCKSTRSLGEGLSKLCEKKEYSLPALDLFIANRKLTKDDLEKKLTRFINKEIVLKEGVLFRLQLPNNVSIGVKADCEKTIDKVLEPILRESGIDIKDIAVCLRDKKQPLNTNCLVSSLHKHHVVIEEHSNHKNKSNDVRKTVDKNSETSSNRSVARGNEDSVFDDIMHGKRQSMAGFSFDENGVFVLVIKAASSKDSLLQVDGSKDNEQGSRSPALFRKKKRDVSQSISTFKSFVVEDDKKGAEELFLLLRRSQNSRLDDQRGLLNKEVELPDFLKLPEKPSKRSSVFDVGVLSPRTRHSPLKKTNSSPASCVPLGNKPPTRTHPSTITERPAHETGFSRNLSGSLLNRGRTKMDGGLQVTNQTQTMDRKRFMNKTLSGSRLRSGSLPPDNPEHVLISGSELRRAETTYHHYGSELSFENHDKHVVWVSNATSMKNRQRGGDRTDHSRQVGDESQREDEGDLNSSKAEVIVPDFNRNAVSIPKSSAEEVICDRPKPITNSFVFQEYIESNKLNMPTPDDQSHGPELTTTATDREAILDNSFLREQLQPSRLFSQLSPDINTLLVTSSPTENHESIKCPLFSPSTPNLGCGGGDDSCRDDSNTDEFPYDNLVFRRSLRSRENHAGSMNGSCEGVGDSGRHGYWGASEIGSEEDSVRVTFV